MRLPRRQFLHLAANAGVLLAFSRKARAQSYPSRPVHWIVGFPPGGGADIVAVQAVVNSPPDGYTLLFLGASAIVNLSLFQSLPFNVLRDIAPVSGLIDYPMVMVAHPSTGFRTVAELIARAKANPGKISLASFGTGTASHLAGELFKMMTGVDMVHIPYRGGAPMIIDLVGGQVQVGFDVMVTSLPHIRTGALRPLGVAGTNRFDMLPEVPSIAETVIRGKNMGGYRSAKGHAAGNHRSDQPGG